MPVERAHALAAVRDGGADYACVPIENSIDGSVLPTFLLAWPSVCACRCTPRQLDVTFRREVQTRAQRRGRWTLAAAPVAAAQVRRWLAAAHLPAACGRLARGRGRRLTAWLTPRVTSPLAAARWG